MSRSVLDTRNGRASFEETAAALIADAANVLLVDRDRLLANSRWLSRNAVMNERWRIAQRLRSILNRRREKRKSPEPTIPA